MSLAGLDDHFAERSPVIARRSAVQLDLLRGLAVSCKVPGPPDGRFPNGAEGRCVFDNRAETVIVEHP